MPFGFLQLLSDASAASPASSSASDSLGMLSRVYLCTEQRGENEVLSRERRMYKHASVRREV